MIRRTLGRVARRIAPRTMESLEYVARMRDEVTPLDASDLSQVRRSRPYAVTRSGVRYLISAAGIPNYGDDFIAASWLRFLARRFPRAEVWLDCLDPDVAAHLLQPIAPSARFTDTLWALTRGLPDDIGYTETRETVLAAIRDRGAAGDAPLAELRGAASIHILGGGYLNSIWPRNLGLIAAAAELSRSAGVPVFATGLGLLPASEPTPELLDDLQQFRHVEVRDQGSAERFGVHHGLDDAFLGISQLRPWSGSAPERMVLLQGDLTAAGARDAYARVIREFLGRQGAPAGEQTAFVEAFPPVDSEMWPELKAAYPEATFVPFTELWERGLSGSPGQTWLTTRFHAHLLAASTGSAGVAVDVKPDYYGVKHASLLDAGTGWTLVDLASDAPLPEPTAAPDFVATARRHSRRKRRLARRLYPHGPVSLVSWFGALARRAARGLRRRVGVAFGRP